MHVILHSWRQNTHTQTHCLLHPLNTRRLPCGQCVSAGQLTYTLTQIKPGAKRHINTNIPPLRTHTHSKITQTCIPLPPAPQATTATSVPISDTSAVGSGGERVPWAAGMGWHGPGSGWCGKEQQPADDRREEEGKEGMQEKRG